MVTFLSMTRPPLVKTMVPVTAKLIVSPLFASRAHDAMSRVRCRLC